MQEDFTTKKKEGLNEIKVKYNELCAKVNIDAKAIEEAIRKGKNVVRPISSSSYNAL